MDLYKLGRMPYVQALNVQQVLFENLKNRSSSPNFFRGKTRVSVDVQNKIDLLNHHKQPNEEDPNSTRSTASLPLAANAQHSIDAINPLLPQPPTPPTSATTQNDPNELLPRNSLILVEHEPVYTIGIRSTNYNDNYVSKLKSKLDEHKLRADFIKTNRGGLITFHGPGQLVAYPILHLDDFKEIVPNRSVKAYVSKLERTIIETLKKVGLDGAHTTKEYPGVWLDEGERKIAFVGIACKRYVTMHGISINCDCDLTWFDQIVSCGIEDKLITSVRQEMTRTGKRNLVDRHSTNKNHRHTSKTLTENQDYGVDQIADAFCLSFSELFDCTLKERNLN